MAILSKASFLPMAIRHLNKARQLAVSAGLDHHFVSEIDHLIATAEANMKEESK